MAKQPRDRDELEGALFPPAPPPPIPVPFATPISGPMETGAVPSAPPMATAAAAAAVPYSHFEYSDETVQAADYEDDGDILPTAPFVPRYEENTPSNRAKNEEERVKLGQTVGRIAAGEDIDAINRARREVNSTQYRASQAVKAANKEGRRRDREGLQITEDRYTSAGGPDTYAYKDTDGHQPYSRPPGGYQVKEYDVSEYSGGEYNISEYKSVYDD